MEPLITSVDFVTVPTRNYDTAVEFYGTVLGLPCPVADSGVCHNAVFNDPDGNVLILHHRYAPRG